MKDKKFNELIRECVHHLNNHQYDKGIRLLNEAVTIYIDEAFTFDFPSVFKGIHISFRTLKNHDLFIRLVLKIIDILEKNGQFKTLCDYLVYLVGDLLELKDDEKALEYLNKGLKIAKDIKEQEVYFVFQNTLANYYTGQKRYEDATEIYSSILEEAGDEFVATKAKAAHNLGFLYKELKQYDQALKFFHLGRSFFEIYHDKSYLSNSYADIAWTYLLDKDYGNAETYFEKAYLIASDLKINSQLVDISKGRKKLCYDIGRYDLAYKYQEEYYERLRLETTHQMKYKVQLELTKQDIENLKKELSASGEVNEELRVLLEELNDSKSLLEAAVLESERVQKELLEKNDALSEAYQNLLEIQDKLLRTEKSNALNRLIMKVAHELNTPLGNVMIILDFFYQKVDKALLLDDRNESMKAIVRATKKIYDNWDIVKGSLNSAAEFIQTLQTSIIDFKNEDTTELYLYDYFKSVELEYQTRMGMACDFHFDIPKGTSIHTSARTLNTVVHQIIDNAFEHGFDENRSNRITITFRDDILVFSNNGKELSEEMKLTLFEPFKTQNLSKKGKLGHGLFIVKSLVEDLLEGSIELLNEPEGVHYKIKLKK